ncbi:MAG: Co2+/Mg2+ efflux protein ApaG [Thermoflexibacter sp.]|nr:Co2+/Mg2+ efflux protein ApaG [Thermoflexibacter sp.]
MVTEITQGVKVSVRPQYMPDYSKPEYSHFVFAYHITIENYSEYTVQLLRRHWFIFDANATVGEVEGEGVIGQQPILEPGDKHHYSSGCNLKTTMGKMKGTYLMERVSDGHQFEVTIPEFIMIVPYILN